jgi:hypothetical protein
MISSFTSGSLGYVDPWLVPHPENVDSYGASLSPTKVEINDPTIPSTSVDTSQHLHPHMEFDQPTPPTWVFDSLRSHDFLDIEFPSDEAILEVMASIDKPREDEHHRESILPDLEPMRVIMMNYDPRLKGIFSSIQ